MDVERNIEHLSIEAKTYDNFDDLVLTNKSDKFQIQIKDFGNVNIDDLSIKDNYITINKKKHKLSSNQNIIFFKDIKITTNDKILNFPCYRLNENIFIVSLSRHTIDNYINKLYKNNSQRQNEIDSFFNRILDERIWEIPIESLPQIKIFITKLQEKSVKISHKLLSFDKLLFIEGKPGVGKSHFVNTVAKEFSNSIVYRFWIDNQDKDYQDRLRFENFIRDLNSKLFYDQKERTEKEILSKLKSENKTFIIDGLDHVENYNNSELQSFIIFIEEVAKYCTTIILSRPLVKKLKWKKQILDNWSLPQTEKVLKELFHITEFLTVSEIYTISKGYPIIVNFLAKHYKLYLTIPKIDTIETIDTYYEQIIKNTKTKQCLSIFLCCNSFIMESEIELFIGDEKEYVEEFVKEYPYLFDIKLNRISLVHDSFNTYLRKHLNYKKKSNKVSEIVTNSILNLEIRFLTRYSFFNLSNTQQKKIIKKYCSLSIYEKIIKNCIDPEAISSFYDQLRESLSIIPSKELNTNQYYDLSLILNLTIREHLSTINTFYYTYAKTLIQHKINEESITSSDFLFSMFYYVKTKNASLLLNRTAQDNYDISHFHDQLENDILQEQNYITKHDRKLDKKIIDKTLKDRLKFKENLTYIIENIYINSSIIEKYEILLEIIKEYINGRKNEAEYQLSIFFSKYNIPEYYPSWILKDVYNNLLSYGYKIGNQNDYLDLSLKQLILKYKGLGSFNLLTEIHNYIRLALLQERKIDISSISVFWTKYYNRKDYTLLSVPTALKTLETKNVIELYQSVELISKIQEISEKGYRGLLADFVKLYPAKEIIPFLEQNFDTNELNIEWFKLPTKYINVLNDNSFRNELYKQINYHRHSLSISFYDIKNALFSKRLNEIEIIFNRVKMTVDYKIEQKKNVNKLQSSEIIFKEQQEQHSNSYRKNSLQRFKEGILDYHNVKFVSKQKLKPDEITKYADGNYTTLPNIDVFDTFPVEEIKQNLKAIMYNSLTGKTNSTRFFHSIYYHPGNALALVEKYEDEKTLDKAIKSFEKFMRLSLFKLELNKKILIQ